MVYRIYVEKKPGFDVEAQGLNCLLYTSPSPRDCS